MPAGVGLSPHTIIPETSHPPGNATTDNVLPLEIYINALTSQLHLALFIGKAFFEILCPSRVAPTKGSMSGYNAHRDNYHVPTWRILWILDSGEAGMTDTVASPVPATSITRHEAIFKLSSQSLTT